MRAETEKQGRVIRTMVAVLSLFALSAQDAPAPFDPATGYRVAQYRAVVPGPPPGVPRVDAAGVARMLRQGGAVLIDVFPAEGGVRDPATGRWRLARPHRTIPGAAWFPEAGRGRVDPGVERWFMDGVAELARGKPGRPIVLFCLADCWMSWNASMRLTRAGYARVHWFGEGADGWRDLGRPLVPATPFGSSTP